MLAFAFEPRINMQDTCFDLGKLHTNRKKMKALKSFTVACACLLLSACAGVPDAAVVKPTVIVRGVDSGQRQVIDDYFSVQPDCGNLGYPEIRILKSPGHGALEIKKGEVYPNFAKDNVRYECNKDKVASSQVLYESTSGFHGKDFFTIQVRFVNSNLRLLTYKIEVL